MTFSTDARFDIEVLEALLLMSASAMDCDAVDLADSYDGAEPWAGDSEANDVFESVSRKDRSAKCWGDRAEYSVQDKGFGIYAVRTRDCVKFVADVDEIQFRDGAFQICDLVVETVETTVAGVELERVTVEPIELPVEAQDVLESGDLEEILPLPPEEAPEGSLDPPPEVEGPPEVSDDDDFVVVVPGDFDSPPMELVPDYAPEIQPELVDDGDSVLAPELSWEVENSDPGETLTEEVWFTTDDQADPAAQTDIANAPVLEVDLSDLTIAEWCEPVPVPIPVPIDDCPVNTDPNAEYDEIVTSEDTSVDGTVAANDSDADGDDLTFWVDEGPKNGSIEFKEDGTYTYTPDPGFSGDDSFTYEVSDGNGGTDFAEVCIYVTAVDDCPMEPDPNQGPDAVDDSATTDQDTAVSGSVADNDSDADGDSLTFWVEEGPTNGSIEFYEDGTYTYTPDPGFSGDDSFTYEVSDGNGGTDIAEVCITVTAVDDCVIEPDPNQAPDAADDGFTTQEDTSFTATVAPNDSDPDGDTLSFWVEEGPVNGSIEFNEDGSYTYTPDPGFSGTDSFTYEANDLNGGIDIATVSIVVEPAPNQLPIAVKDYNEMTSCDVTVTGNVLLNDRDADCDGLTVTLISTASNGTVTLDSDGNYTYTPDPGFVGHDVFIYEVSDGNGGTAVADVCIEVIAHEPPDAVDDSAQTEYETAVDGNVLTNDTDPDGDTLVATLVTSTTNGTVTLAEDGSFTYTPDARFSGQDSFIYQISDQECGVDTAVVTIDVAPKPNEAPDAVDDTAETCEDVAVEGNVLANDVDVDGDTLTAVPMTDVQTSAGGIVTLHEDGSFVYMPADGYSGVDTFVYSMSDGNGGTASATVTITVHDVPDPQDDMFTGDQDEAMNGNVVLNDGDVSDTQSVVVVDGPTNGTLTLNADGTFNYIPDDGFFGEDSFTYAINGECGPSDSADVRLVVTEVVWDTTIVSSGNGSIWGDPHFEGDDGGLYDVQGEAGHIYNLLSDYELQVNALFIPWEGHEGSTMIGAVGATLGTDLVQADFNGTTVNGLVMQVGEVRTIADGTVEFDGEYTRILTDEYDLSFRKREGWFDMKLRSVNPFVDNVAPHGLWGLTVDGDAEARHGDYFKDDWNYALQGGGALDTVDENGNVVRSQRGDDTAYKLYEVANLFSTEALNAAGEVFFRFNAAQGTGLTRM